MLRVHMFSKRIFLCFHIITFGTFPPYASSSHDFEKNLFVFPQNHTYFISVICIVFAWFQKYSFCFTRDSHLLHFRHMHHLHMSSKILFLFHYRLTLITFPSYASSSHCSFNSFLFSSMLWSFSMSDFFSSSDFSSSTMSSLKSRSPVSTSE